MNILKIIQMQAEPFTQDQDGLGMQAVLSHLDRAADLLEDGKKENDAQFFNDVIYRTNQAYEGILKEAYNVISGSDGGRMRLYDIENYFKDNDILSGRVLDLFENYRRQWRNPSTHDYQLFFSVNEAFLAIVSVVAFTHALLDRMVELESLSRNLSSGERSIGIGRSIGSMDFVELIEGLSTTFLENNQTLQLNKPALLGELTAFWLRNGVEKNNIKREEGIEENGFYRYYDFCIRTGANDNGIIIEVLLNPRAAALEAFSNVMRNDIETKGYRAGFILVVGAEHYLKRVSK